MLSQQDTLGLLVLLGPVIIGFIVALICAPIGLYQFTKEVKSGKIRF